MTRIVTQSRALLAREQRVFERYTASLASLLAEETRPAAGDLEPHVVANALIGTHRALIDYVRARVRAGEDDLDALGRDCARRAGLVREAAAGSLVVRLVAHELERRAVEPGDCEAVALGEVDLDHLDPLPLEAIDDEVVLACTLDDDRVRLSLRLVAAGTERAATHRTGTVRSRCSGVNRGGACRSGSAPFPDKP